LMTPEAASPLLEWLLRHSFSSLMDLHSFTWQRENVAICGHESKPNGTQAVSQNSWRDQGCEFQF
jgi:hypothetical protein